MTKAGQAALACAEHIFQRTQPIPDEVRVAASGKVARLAVGLSDGISTLAAHALLAPVLATPALRLLCHGGRVRATAGRAGDAPPGPGLGVFPVSRFGAGDAALMRGLRRLGHVDGVPEEIHAICAGRGRHHPLVLQFMAASRP